MYGYFALPLESEAWAVAGFAIITLRRCTSISQFTLLTFSELWAKNGSEEQRSISFSDMGVCSFLYSVSKELFGFCDGSDERSTFY